MDRFLKRKSNEVEGKKRKSQKVVVRKYDSDYIKYCMDLLGQETILSQKYNVLCVQKYCRMRH